MRPDFDQHCRAAVGWTPGSIGRYAHDILAINQPGSPPNMTDVIRKYAEMVRDGQVKWEEKNRDDDDDDTTGPPVPRDPKPPTKPDGSHHDPLPPAARETQREERAAAPRCRYHRHPGTKEAEAPPETTPSEPRSIVG